jgi:CHAT domain-containing protein/tetratricopeptide (TPR) repeat protein
MRLCFLRQGSVALLCLEGALKARRTLWPALVLALLAMFAAPQSSRAQEPAAVSVPEASNDASAEAFAKAKNAADALTRAGRFAEAIPLAEEALRLSETIHGLDHAETGVIAHNLGFLLRRVDRLPEAQAQLERALAIHERVKPAVNDDTLNAIGELGQIYLRIGRGVEIVAIYERLIGRAAAEGDAAHIGVGHMHSNAGFVLRILKRPNEAEPHWRSAIAIYDGHPSQDEDSYRLTVEALLDRHESLGRTEEQRTLIAASLAKLRSRGQGEGEAALRLLGRSSRLEHGAGRYAQSRDQALAALAIMDRGAPDAIAKTAQADEPLNNLARAERGLANYAAAEQHYKRAIAILDKQRDIHNSGILNDNLAVLYGLTGRFAEAEQHSRRALQLLEQAFGREHRNVGRAAGNFGVLLHESGRFPEAEPFLRRALAITEAQSPQDPVSIAIIVDNLAGVLRVTGREQAAMEPLQRALALFEKNLPANHPSQAAVRNNLGRLLMDLGRHAEAEAPLRQALATEEALYGPEHVNIAFSATNLGEVYLSKGDRQQARALLQRALAITERHFGTAHPKLLTTLIAMGELELAENHPRQALDILERAAAIALASRARLSPGAGPAYGSRSRQVFNRLLNALWRSGGEGNEARAIRALEIGQWNTMTAATAALAALGARAGAGDPALSALTRESQDLAAEWQASDKRLTELLSQTSRDDVLEKSRRDRLAAIETRLAAIDAELRAKFPRYGDLAQPVPLARDELRRLLRPNEAAIQYVVAPDATYVWAVTATATKWLRLAIGEQDMLSLVRSIRCGLDRAEWSGGGRERCLRLLNLPAETMRGDADLPPFQAERAHALYTILMGGLGDVIAGKHLLIVPSGPLTALPFQVLVTEKPGAGIGVDGAGFERAAWLGRRQAITVLPSLASLKSLREHAKTSQAASPFLGIGNPLLSGQDGADKSAWERQTCLPIDGQPAARMMEMASLSPTPQILRGGFGNVEALRHLTPLPETADELCGVAKFLGAPKEAVLLGASATEGRIKSLSANGVLADARILHMATHGLLAGEAEMFLASRAEPSLILTPPEAATEADDGLLTASEVAALKLDADWVILSACNTAGGEHVGAEALSGLARAFFYAGARSLLVSHWAVDSDATVSLITRAFEEMTRNPRLAHAEALQRSMVALIDAGGYRAHPAYWAPFAVVGSPGTLPEAAEPAAVTERATAPAVATPAAAPATAAPAAAMEAPIMATALPPLPVRARAVLPAALSEADATAAMPPLPTRAPVSKRSVRAVKPAEAAQSAAPRPRRKASPAPSEPGSEEWEGDDVFAR